MPGPAVASQLEILRPNHQRGPFRCAVLDFDGTLSLIRANWQGIMIPLMVEVLARAVPAASRAELETIVTEFVVRLTGQPTIVQMQALVDEMLRRSARPLAATDYLAQYQAELLAAAGARVAAIESGRDDPDRHMVPGARGLVEALAARGLHLVIASGTEWAHVVRETEILNLTNYFGDRIHGPVNDDPTFTKLAVFQRLLVEENLRGEEVVIIGDGTAEVLAAREIGALAIGVASDEVARDGRLNPLKAQHLRAAGADLLVADYRDLPALLSAAGL
ncbi:MAG: HAD family hydrolase [Pirellulaceae bacterium]|nr:HAD family hydrolase [Pirellulaceae bacterium]